MVGALSFLPIFLIGFTSAQCPTPCSTYKVFNIGEMCGPDGSQFHCGGQWKLQSPNPHPKCTQTISGRRVNVCMYRREEDNKEYCFCDPGSSRYEQRLLSGESCARDCLTTTEKKTCVFLFILEYLFSDTGGRLADGHNRSVLVYNGKLPGPTITVCEGDDVVVNLINNLDPHNSTTLHFHGIRQKQKSSSYDGYSEGGPWSDGVPRVTQCPIPACPNPTPIGNITDSCTFTYKFLGSGSIDAPYNNAPAGTYWYHSHVGSQRVNGAAGKLIIMPRQKRSDVDIDDPDNSLFLQEWYSSTENEEPPASLLVNGKGKQSQNHQLSTIQPDYEVFYINHPGKSYRFRIIGGIGDDVPIRISIEDHTFTAISTDSIDIDPVHNLDALWITAGERYDIVIQTKNAPRSDNAYKINVFHSLTDDLCSLAWLKYPLQTLNSSYKANCTQMEYAPFTKVLNPVPKHVSQWGMPNFVYPNELRALAQARNVGSFLNTQYISMTDELTFNDYTMEYPDIPFLFQSPSDDTNRCGVKCTLTSCEDYPTNCTNTTIPRKHVFQQPWSNTGSDWFEIILINGPGTAHPIHHHGGWFNIVGMGQFNRTITRNEIIGMNQNGTLHRNFTLPVFKDTIQVPTNGYVIFRAPIDNSGVWLVHCHIEKHFVRGMAMVFQIGEPDGSDKWSMGPDQTTAMANKNHNCF